MDAAAQRRLDAYFSDIGDILAHPLRRGSFATYAMGLLGAAERKSIEPIAARACPDPARVQAAHQSLQHFISRAPGSSSSGCDTVVLARSTAFMLYRSLWASRS
ncbi:transposase [Sorangium sp. So ce861]|uniref:transposase n=1 Tax=Sorangium sp. So ce861 TaxID=3133323 RepID=UPI003F5FBD72